MALDFTKIGIFDSTGGSIGAGVGAGIGAPTGGAAGALALLVNEMRLRDNLLYKNPLSMVNKLHRKVPGAARLPLYLAGGLLGGGLAGGLTGGGIGHGISSLFSD